MTQMAYEMDVDYVNYLYHKLFGYTCMFSIRGKHLISNHFNFAKTWFKVIKASCFRLKIKSLYHLKVIKASCHFGSVLLSVAAQALLLTFVCRFLSLSLSLLVMLLMAISEKSRLWVLDYVLEPVTGVELPKKVFTSRARWMPLHCRVSLPLKCYTFASVLSFEAFSASLPWILKQSCNNLTYTLIMSLYASYVCVCIFASSRIPRSILRWRTPHFWADSITVGIKGRLRLNTHSKHLKTATTLSSYKDYSSLLRWQANICLHIATMDLHRQSYVVILVC
jgi:hypothetical protein